MIGLLLSSEPQKSEGVSVVGSELTSLRERFRFWLLAAQGSENEAEDLLLWELTNYSALYQKGNINL